MQAQIEKVALSRIDAGYYAEFDTFLPKGAGSARRYVLTFYAKPGQTVCITLVAERESVEGAYKVNIDGNQWLSRDYLYVQEYMVDITEPVQTSTGGVTSFGLHEIEFIPDVRKTRDSGYFIMKLIVIVYKITIPCA